MASSSTEMSRRHSSVNGFTRWALGVSAVAAAPAIISPFSPARQVSKGRPGGRFPRNPGIHTILPEEACKGCSCWACAHHKEFCLNFGGHGSKSWGGGFLTEAACKLTNGEYFPGRSERNQKMNRYSDGAGLISPVLPAPTSVLFHDALPVPQITSTEPYNLFLRANSTIAEPDRSSRRDKRVCGGCVVSATNEA